MTYDHNKKFGLLKFLSGYGKKKFNSPKGYSRKIINAETVSCLHEVKKGKNNQTFLFYISLYASKPLQGTDRFNLLIDHNTEAGLSDTPPPCEIK